MHRPNHALDAGLAGAHPLDDGGLIDRLPINEDVLHHVIAILVPRQDVHVVQDLIQDRGDYLVVVPARATWKVWWGS